MIEHERIQNYPVSKTVSSVVNGGESQLIDLSDRTRHPTKDVESDQGNGHQTCAEDSAKLSLSVEVTKRVFSSR